MENKPSNFFTYLLLAAVGLCFVALAFQAAQIRELQREVSNSSEALQKARDDAAEMQHLVERQEARIDALEDTPGRAAAV